MKAKKSARNLMKKMNSNPGKIAPGNMSKPAMSFTESNPDNKAIHAGGGRIMAIKRGLRKA